MSEGIGSEIQAANKNNFLSLTAVLLLLTLLSIQTCRAEFWKAEAGELKTLIAAEICAREE